MDKRLFKSLVLHILHHLRDLLWMVRTWSSIAPIFSSLFTKSAESNHFLLEHIPWMNKFHDPRRPFKVAITTSTFFTSDSIKDHLIPQVYLLKTPNEMFYSLTKLFEGKNINRKMTSRNQLKNVKPYSHTLQGSLK